MKVKVKCKECGHKPEPSKEKSNENWEVYDMKCPKCGGRMELKLDE